MITTAKQPPNADEMLEDFYMPRDGDEPEDDESSENRVVIQERKVTSKKIVRRERLITKGVVFVFFTDTTSTTRTTTETRTVTADSIDDQIPVFLETVYSLSSQGKIRIAMDIVFRKINSLLNVSDFRSCDEILMQVEVDRLPSTLLVGFLSITLSQSPFLVKRPLFFAKVRAKILAEKGPLGTATLLDKYNGR